MPWEILPQAVADGLIMGAVFALIAMGLSLIWGVMDIVNFAHAEYLMVAMYLAYWAWASPWAIDPLLSLPAVALIHFCLGVLTYRLLIRRIIGAPMVSQIFTTFGLMLFIRYVAFFLWEPRYRLITNPLLEGTLEIWNLRVGIPHLGAAVGSLLTAAALFAFLQYTKIGKALRATAQDQRVALSLGIQTDRMFALAWGLGIAAVGVAGVLLANFFYIYPEVGQTFILLAFASVAIGGFGSIQGSFLGGILIGLSEQLFGGLVSPGFKHAFIFLIFILVLLLRPKGLFGR